MHERKKESEVTQLCLTLCDPMDCSLPGSSIHGIFQARVLEWVAISFPRGSSRPRDQTQVSCVVGRCFTIWATREVPRVGSNSCPLSWWCHPTSHLALLLPPSIFPNIRVFSNESVLRIRWSKYWSFIISPSSEYSRLISFRVDWLELLAVQGTLKSLL